MKNAKNYLVIGGQSAIGQILGQRLADEGHSVYVISRNPVDAERSANIYHATLNILNDSLQSLDEFLPERLDGMVYCPGTINLKPFTRLTEDDFINDFKINVLGAVRIIQYIIARLKKADQASVVLFSTVAVKSGMPFHASVAAAKAAVEGLARSLAAEYAKSGIRFNVVAPSITDTPMAAYLLNSEQKVEASKKRHPIKAIGQPRDMAEGAYFLITEQSRWMTGQILHIDGGLSSLFST
ncbi:MAG: SDR family oxidoreductase [Caldithrix sp.]|nr:SDR family oxidoreductase [Caldithrix sp.]